MSLVLGGELLGRSCVWKEGEGEGKQMDFLTVTEGREEGGRRG